MESNVVALHTVRDSWDLRTDHLKELRSIRRFEKTSESSLMSIKVGLMSLRSEHMELTQKEGFYLWKDSIYKEVVGCNVY